MATALTDFSSLLEGIPAGAWVAISERDNAVVAYGSDAQNVVNIAKEKGEEHPLITRVPERAAMMFF